MKLDVREAGSAAARRISGAADALATSIVAYAEARAAFARLVRERPAGARHDRRRVARRDEDWERYMLVELTPAVARSAGEIAARHALRGFDAIHLASALWLRASSSEDFVFMAFDRRLAAAASAAGLRTEPAGAVRASARPKSRIRQ